MKKNDVIKHCFNIFLIIIGTFIMGSAFNIFYAPNDIILGGFGGIATIISYIIQISFGVTIPISAIYLFMNAILYYFAVKILGKNFALYALVGILGYSLFLEVCKFPSISDDLLLSGIYGAVLSGVGVGLIIRVGGSTGGGDMLGCMINHKKPTISVGWVTICINTVVVIISIFIYGLDKSLYAIIAIFISGKTADFIIEGPKSVKAFYIISNKADEISNAIMKIVQRGVTSFDAYGKYSGKQLQVLMCLVNGRQRNDLKQIIYDIDPNAFVFAVSVKEAMGKGFMKLEKQKSLLFKKELFKPASLHIKSKKNNFIIKSKKDNLKNNTKIKSLRLKD